MTDIKRKPILSLYTTTKDDLKNLAIKNGRLIFIRDTFEIALDLNGERALYGVNSNSDVQINFTFTINEEGELIVTYADNSFENLGIVVGKDGAEGPQGPKGDKGDTGPIGPQGIQGSKGDQGDAGPQGEKGQDGTDGLTPYINANGTWQIGDTDTGIKAAGADGKDGAQGVQGEKGDAGEKGADGVSITKTEINDNGELVITLSDNTVSTLGVVVGEKGDTGEQGPQGEQGYPGVKGYTPQKGIDYWTVEDIAEIQSYIDTQLGVIENGSY